MPTTSPAIATEKADRPSDDEAVLAEWTVHLARSQPAKLLGIAAAIAAASCLGWMAFDGWVGALLGGVLLLSAVAEFLLPIRYRLTTNGAYCSYGLARLMIPWRSVRRIIEGTQSVRLSPFRTPSRLDAFRGVELRYPEQVEGLSAEMVRSIVQQNVAIVSRRTGMPGDRNPEGTDGT
jgi:hypothetical protein